MQQAVNKILYEGGAEKFDQGITKEKRVPQARRNWTGWTKNFSALLHNPSINQSLFKTLQFKKEDRLGFLALAGSQSNRKKMVVKKKITENHYLS